MRRRVALGWASGVALLALGIAKPAFALDATSARGRAQVAISGVESDMGKVQAAAAQATVQRLTPEQRIAAGDILLRSKDYPRAIDVLEQVVELHRQGQVGDSSNADASFLLGEAYYQSKQYLSARRHFLEIFNKASESAYTSYAGQSLSRLVDIALHTNNLGSLNDIYAKLGQMQMSDPTGALQYARAKASFAEHDYASAKTEVGSVPPSTEYYPQAQYLLGAILVKEATPAPPPPAATGGAAPANSAAPPSPPPTSRYAAAIDQFRKVTQLPPDTDAHRHVIDLGWMAIGRLLYETENYLDAAQAYSHVDRKSPEFDTMLYELAWVYVRLGDYERAERALEVLSITDPEAMQLADSELLRADLMLRSGEFDKSLALYRNVRGHFDPIRQQLDQFLKTTTDPAVYYDKLVEDQLQAGTGVGLDPLVLKWARQESHQDRAFAVIDNMSRSRDLIKRSRQLISKLQAVLASPTRVKAFPEIKASLEVDLGLLNKIALARRTLAEGMDDVAGSNVGGELAQVRAQRRALMARMGWLPVTPGDFARRDAEGNRQWNQVSQQLQRLTLETDKLQAIVNGLKRVLKDADQYGVVRDPLSRQRFESEIDANERDLEGYRKRIRDLRAAIDLGRVQIGFGDERYVQDDQVRAQFRQVFAREVELVAAGQDNGEAAAYARSIQPLLSRADADAMQLENEKAALERQAAEKASGVQQEVAKESANIELYAKNLDTLDQQARLVVGQLAMKNFGLVRDRLKSIVLRSDVGIVQEAWEVREEERFRVINLQRERAREEQQLNDELREVIDDAGDTL
jgi:tetratricopeptide (TPR) repeat protein